MNMNVIVERIDGKGFKHEKNEINGHPTNCNLYEVRNLNL